MKRMFSNDDTVAVHVTRACNLRCAHCYQDDYPCGRKEMRPDAVFAALDRLTPANIVLYGGEPLTRPGAARAIMARYPKKGFILHTNGTLGGEGVRDILERCVHIFLTLESFFPERQPKGRSMSRALFVRLMGFVERYADKIRVVHNIYPEGNDRGFLKMARLRGLDVAVYPIVSPGTAETGGLDMDEALFRSLPVLGSPLTLPKLRVLEDGTVTRDMRGIYNGDGELPVSGKCRECPQLSACPFCSMFPHFCKDVIKAMYPAEPWFCTCTRRYAHV